MNPPIAAGLAVFAAIAFAPTALALESQPTVESDPAPLDGARTLHVANNGMDAADCGERHAPCRSIGQTIANANAGDTILVGIGRYGDVNGDGTFGGPGEEQPGAGGCLICVTKSLRILSVHGAVSTVIDATSTHTPELLSAVLISADATTFGAPDKGFTITNSPRDGLMVQSAGDVRIAGNVSLNNANFGFHFIAGRGPVTASENVATASQFGFFVFGPFATGSPARVDLVSNVATRNTSTGFVFVTPDGVTVSHRLLGNVASNNGNFTDGAGNGVVLSTSGVLVQNNTFAANVTGMLINESDSRVFGNTIVGNLRTAIIINPDAGPGNRVNRNNIYGNVVAGCEIENQSGQRLDARNNYWGSPTGSVPPARPACSAPGPTLVQPVASQPFAIRP